MNETLQNQVATLLADTMTQAGQVKQFALDQAPDVIRQFLMWELLNSFLLCGLSVVCTIVGIICFLRLVRTTDKQGGMSFWGPYYLLGGVCLLVIALFAFNTHWLHIWIAPKDYLIREALKISL